MDGATLRAICDQFRLGEPRGAPQPVAGGLTNLIWRLATDRGAFAIKIMNRDVEDSGSAAWIERAFQLEQAAFRTGVPMPRPLPVPATGRCLAELPADGGPPASVRVHAWVEGEQLDNGHVYPPEDAAQVGVMLARIHALRMTTDVTASEALYVFGDDAWREYAARADAARAPWAADYRSLLPVLSELDAYLAAAHADVTPLIISHRDADKKNIVRTTNGLVLADWDQAGPVNPRHDLANCALVWAGVRLGEPDRALACAFIDAYRRAGGSDAPFQHTDLAEIVSAQLGWFRFNVRRALGRAPARRERRGGGRRHHPPEHVDAPPLRPLARRLARRPAGLSRAWCSRLCCLLSRRSRALRTQPSHRFEQDLGAEAQVLDADALVVAVHGHRFVLLEQDRDEPVRRDVVLAEDA